MLNGVILKSNSGLSIFPYHFMVLCQVSFWYYARLVSGKKEVETEVFKPVQPPFCLSNLFFLNSFTVSQRCRVFSGAPAPGTINKIIWRRQESCFNILLSPKNKSKKNNFFRKILTLKNDCVIMDITLPATLPVTLYRSKFKFFQDLDV